MIFQFCSSKNLSIHIRSSTKNNCQYYPYTVDFLLIIAIIDNIQIYSSPHWNDDIMLRRMVLRNFQSFGEIELDLSGKSSTVKNNAFIYGENGSGKSNLMNSVFMLLVTSGLILDADIDSNAGTDDRSDETLVREARRLRMIGSEDDMCMTFVFSVDGKDASYEVRFDPSGKLVYESLIFKLSERKGRLFTFSSDGERYLVRGLIKDKRLRDKIKGDLDQYWGYRSFMRIIGDEFRNSNPDFIEENVNENLLRFRDQLLRINLRAADFTLIRPDSLRLPAGRIDRSRKEILDTIEDVISRFFSRLYTDVSGAYFERKEEGDTICYNLFFKRRISGVVRDIPFEMESTGTKVMLNNLGLLLSCVNGDCVFMDEIDTGIHDLLITDVLKQTIPDIRGQLIATTHNTCLMDALSPDNVYIIGIDRQGFKRIFTAASKGVRPTNSIRHKFLSGYLEGVPYIADLGMTDLSLRMRGGE